MFSFLKKLFAKKTVDSIIADITAKVEHLHIVAEAQAKAEKLHQEEIKARLDLVTLAQAERNRAIVIATKLKDLVS